MKRIRVRIVRDSICCCKERRSSTLYTQKSGPRESCWKCKCFSQATEESRNESAGQLQMKLQSGSMKILQIQEEREKVMNEGRPCGDGGNRKVIFIDWKQKRLHCFRL